MIPFPKLSPTALIVDDEVQIRRLLRAALEGAGYQVGEAGLGKAGLAEIAMNKPDVVILDLGLPDMEGTEVLRRLREWSQIPVLVASIRQGTQEKISALDAGADDYVSKPFETGELLARLRAIQRRAGAPGESPHLECGPLYLDLTAHQAILDGRTLRLTPTEFAVLKVLASHPGRIITHAQMLTGVWGAYGEGQGRTLRVHINSLRKKLAAHKSAAPRIFNEAGIGYRLVTEDY